MVSIVQILKELLKAGKLPVPLRQGLEVKGENFDCYDGAFDDVFAGAKSVTLSRSDVFEAYWRRGARIGCLTTIAWGFQRGRRPGGRSLKSAIDAIPFMCRTLAGVVGRPLTHSDFDALNSKPEVKNGVTTKVLYFGSFRTSDGQALIYDSRVQEYILTVQPEEYASLIKTLSPHRREPTAAEYFEYVRITADVAQQVGIEPDVVEMFMFMNAPGMKGPTHGDLGED